MVFVKWLALALLDLALLLTLPHVALFTAAVYWAQPWFSFNPAILCVFLAMVMIVPIIAAFTGPQPYGKRPYTWGGWWGTYDNPPQGDEGYVAKRAPFPSITDGLKGYINRVNWMIRNPLYGFARRASVAYWPAYSMKVRGNPDISDKYRVPGWYFVTLRDGRDDLAAFEFYGVLPYTKARNLRVRLGWKILTRKFEANGFAPLVNTCNPFDGYGDD